jgi:hypothetical protein
METILYMRPEQYVQKFPTKFYPTLVDTILMYLYLILKATIPYELTVICP